MDPHTCTDVKTYTAAMCRLVKIALTDTGQGARCANFVLAWWNAGVQGGFDLTDLCNVDRAIADDMLAVFVHIAALPTLRYPDEFRPYIEDVIALHRPQHAGRRRKARAA